MKSKTTTVITILFATILVGIIIIQAWWIHRAIELNGQQFDAATYRSLENVVKQTEQVENVAFMQNAMGVDSIIHTKKTAHAHKKTNIPHDSLNSLLIDISNNVSVISHNAAVISHNAAIISRNAGEISRHVSVLHHNGTTLVTVESTKRINNRTAKCFFFYENPDTGSYLHNPMIVREMYPTPMQQLTEKLEKIANIDTLVQKMIHLKNPDSLTIKPEDIEKLIQGQLTQNNLPDTFYFALLRPNGRYVYRSPHFNDTSQCYKISLYPNDLFGRNILLFVSIPGKLNYIHSDVWWAFVLSLILITILLILFLYTIQILIRHKNLLAAKNDFINHMSHEIKTPLAGISLGADMLIEKSGIMTTAQIGKVAHSIKEQSSRLHKDISTVLLNSLADEAEALKFSSFNIIDTITRALNEFKLILENKNAKVETSFPHENIMVNGNEMLWQKVFCNLVDNSIKFSYNNLIIRIRISFSNSNTLLIQFSDNGIGINKEDLPHIFDKFYRSNYYKQSHIQGFGLGLSFVKNVVETHHGIIKAESDAGKGTTISIEIPISIIT